jgi:PAS domain S-box-containing protein
MMPSVTFWPMPPPVAWGSLVGLIGLALCWLFEKQKGARRVNELAQRVAIVQRDAGLAQVQYADLAAREKKDQARIAMLENDLREKSGQLDLERDLLNSLMNNSPDMIYFKDTASRFIRCSQAQANNFNRGSYQEMIGKTDFDFFSEEHARPAFEDEQAIIRTGQPLIGKVEKETWLDGRVSWVLTSKIPLRDGTGRICGTVGTSKDITDIKLAESKVEELHKQLQETSRLAGMAEVATSVLHNVGNVLNSVNVSATVVTEKLRNSKLDNIVKLAALMDKNPTDLAAFLVNDPRGQRIAPYIKSMGEHLLAERQDLIDELSHLQKQVGHINEIVAMQQNHAKVSGVLETVALVELIEDALRINSSALSRHQVKLERKFAAEPIVSTERHKVLQILVNLIENAKYSCSQSSRIDKQITVHLGEENKKARIQVVDNGVGIPAENLTRIFSHGFTTKKNGHGFGLHSGALAAKELGGMLVATSAGVGLGATFLLEIPLAASNSDRHGVDQSIAVRSLENDVDRSNVNVPG